MCWSWCIRGRGYLSLIDNYKSTSVREKIHNNNKNDERKNNASNTPFTRMVDFYELVNKMRMANLNTLTSVSLLFFTLLLYLMKSGLIKMYFVAEIMTVRHERRSASSLSGADAATNYIQNLLVFAELNGN